MSAPKTCTEWRGRYVTVTKRMETMTGTVFHPGERLKVIRRAKDGTLTLQRPAAAIIGHLDDHISFAPAEEGGKS